MENPSQESSVEHHEVLLKLYEQSCENARAYMDLRFKHFTTFMFLTGLLGAITFQVEALKNFRPLFCVMAVILTVLFWLMDNRTSYHQRTELIRIKSYEELMKAPQIKPPATTLKIKATLITNLIFLVILLSWSYMAYTQRYNASVQSPAVETKEQNSTNTQRPAGKDEQELKK